MSKMLNLKLTIYQAIYKWTKRRIKGEVKKWYQYRQEGILSDHAVLRYIERNNLCDVDFVRNIMSSQKVFDNIKELRGDGKFVVDDVAYVVKNGIIVTVYPHIPGKPTKIKDGKRIWQF